MHIFTADIGLVRIVFQILDNIGSFSVHAALDIANLREAPIIEHRLVMDEPAWIYTSEITGHL